MWLAKVTMAHSGYIKVGRPQPRRRQYYRWRVKFIGC